MFAISKPKIIVILGPTSSGKSELAVKIAKKFNGEIISADSRQIYKELNIGSGKVSLKFCNDDNLCNRINYHQNFLYYKNIIHHLLNIANPKRIFTVSQYQKLAKKALVDILKRGKIPIICGGAGLYIDSIIYDVKFPEIPPQPTLRKKLEKLTTEKLFKKLKKLDPRRVKNIDKYNRRRLIRALEIVIFTGKPVSPAIRTDSGYDVLKIGINLSKKILKKRIEKRIEKMLKNGLLDEVKKLKKQKLSWNRIHSFGFEYKYPAMFLQNKISNDEMIQQIIKENWRYTKRQMTWFKRDKTINWTINEKEAIKLVKNNLI